MEAVATNNGLRMIDRRQPAPIGELGPNQLAWCRKQWPWFEHPRVIRLEQQRAAEAYRLPELVEARVTVSEIV